MDQHEAAHAALVAIAEGSAAWAIPVFVLAEFLRVSTHLRVLRPPSDLEPALGFVEALLGSPSVRVIAPGQGYWPLLSRIVVSARARGNEIHDAAIAAVCLEWGATEILTEDRDFDRFEGIKVRRLA